MSRICRTCLLEITSNRYVDINMSEFTRKQFQFCIPELDLDLVLEPILCSKCVEALNAAYYFKSCCLQTEQCIKAHVEMLKVEQQNVELDAVLGNSYNGINSMAMHCGNDITNDFNAVHDHSRTVHNLEDYKDAKGECSVTSETFEGCIEVNYDGFKEESIEIEEHECDTFIKSESEMFDTGSDAEITSNLQQWSEFENGFNLELQDSNGSSQQQDVESNEQLEDIKTELDIKPNVTAMQWEHNYALAAVKGAAGDHIFLPESSRSEECEEYNESSGKTSTKSSGLLRQYNKLDLMNYNANDENCNSAMISAVSSTMQGNTVNKSQVGSMEPNRSSSVRLFQQSNVNETKIADTSNIHSIKRRFKNISSIKSHSTTNNLCKGANRRMHYRCHQKEKNIKEQIVAKSELHSELLRDWRMDLTRMDISSAEEMLNLDQQALMKGVQTQVKKSSHLKCDMHIKTNTAATEAVADLHSVIDCSPLHLKHSNTSALYNSNIFTNVSLQHFINSNNLSVKDQELSIRSQFLNTIGKNSYKCDQCDYASSKKSSIVRHLRQHTGEKPYKCYACNYAGSQKSHLNNHLRTHTGERPYKCSQCDYACSQKNGLNLHLKTHTGEKPYKCDQCEYASPRKSRLKMHSIENHTREKPYKCNVCNYASSQESVLNDHLLTHTGKKPYKCDQCDFACSINTSLRRHMKKHTEEKPYKCNVCNYAVFQKSQLNNHLRTHTGERPYKCSQCDYACSQKNNLIVHLRNHTGKKPYKCNVCNYASSQKSVLNDHLRIHTGKKPYKCDQCDFACSIKTSLKRHMRKHTGEKPYKCDQCDYACSIKSILKVHNMRKHTGEKPYKCNVCNYAAIKQADLNNHIRTHTGEKPYKCDQCDYACAQKGSLILHMRKHSGEKPYKCNVCDYASSQKSALNNHLRTHTGKKLCKGDG